MDIENFPKWEEVTSKITDSRFLGHPKIEPLHTNCTKAGARIIYDHLWSWFHSRQQLAKPEGWIRVEDKPIPDNSYTMVWVTTILMPDIARYIADGQRFESTTSDWYLEEVSHWQPLPHSPLAYEAENS